MHDSLDKHYLQQTIVLAKTRQGFCAPNPSVGAVVVRDGVIIAEGVHEKAGAPHAEVMALNQLTIEQSQGATLYVSLEPCNHEGRTPPCSALILEKKIARVVFAYKDPNANVKGNGQQFLSAAGVDCVHLSSLEADHFYQSYAWYCVHHRPFVVGKLALSLNGKIAEKAGARVAITGSAVQAWVHEQRRTADALLTTAQTIIHDDPYLNVRLSHKSIAKPLYILDRCLRIPLTANIFQTNAPLTFFYAQGAPEKIEALQAQGARCIHIAASSQHLSLTEVLDYLGREGVHHLWIEAGGSCFQQFVIDGLMNRAYLAIGLKWLSAEALDAFSVNIFSKMQAQRWIKIGNEVVCDIMWNGCIYDQN